MPQTEQYDVTVVKVLKVSSEKIHCIHGVSPVRPLSRSVSDSDAKQNGYSTHS